MEQDMKIVQNFNPAEMQENFDLISFQNAVLPVFNFHCK